MIKKKIALTFDYELFLGSSSGTIENCILKPTDLILDLLTKHSAVATFFIDATFLLRLRKSESKSSDFNAIVAQIGRILSTGSRVELHIHPHWSNAIEAKHNWLFNDFSNYRLHSFNREEIENIFEECITILHEICRIFDSKYQIKIFRAGGFCLQEFEKLKSSFDLNKIYIDSSALPRMSYVSSHHYFNYKKLKNLDPYRFNSEPNVPCTNGKYIELPISTFHESIFKAIIDKAFKKNKYYKNFGDGIGVPTKNLSIFKRFSLRYKYFTLDAAFDLSCKDRISNYKNSKVNILSHPKSMNEKSIESLELMLKEPNFDFVNLIDFAAEI